MPNISSCLRFIVSGVMLHCVCVYVGMFSVCVFVCRDGGADNRKPFRSRAILLAILSLPLVSNRKIIPAGNSRSPEKLVRNWFVFGLANNTGKTKQPHRHMWHVCGVWGCVLCIGAKQTNVYRSTDRESLVLLSHTSDAADSPDNAHTHARTQTVLFVCCLVFCCCFI